MKIHHDSKKGDGPDAFTITPHTDARLAALNAIRLWSNIDDLARYAVARHGFTNTNSYSGVTYPTDLDEYDLSQRDPIPTGFLEVTGGYAGPSEDDHLIPETEYLELLRQYFTIRNRHQLAATVAHVIKAAPDIDG